ncbi:phospho-N-acetylmuramoyl-pentapeptide-transferase [Candidatus Desantisbacteria bacterium CG1_02_38_46]|uniref:Phospho-N-acetylmuramoyl-pentapeptide-transferase n=3 Tax=unclassified Candidatus Desantisiibacteriota TaxID=3106372 RepID=A0A2H9PAH7_9BACT|nr:MAG: phospho-N-acetylmuramoyl-pentapeptide-transferase [Candidatus Desantisbacteria bacterium CG1_02_38_46]PIU51387.1 MAG: phospho-N-acetylmuramoyl-pentapeptide-transferase [Candidatus Desantisbacteria bacterium CG07_land_8_20_14_0_80_39_15]PIZ15404.1 MAG: phospho-N-acetylmuramoyl-pentapeptide-transferase [Candidatus Desantisbacteria bacterium CG_4_10_14_0_8_um_filter_39_17]
MLYYLLYPLHKYFFAFNVFKYITFRAAGAALTSLILGITLGPVIIKMLQGAKIGDQIREFPFFEQLHKKKIGTPTMGGIVILSVLIISTLLWSRFENALIQLILFTTIYLGLLGFLDDYLKLKGKKGGLGGWYKLLGQAILGLVIGFYLYYFPPARDFHSLTTPFLKELTINLGWFYILFVLIVIVSSSNAVNLTDGLDGLAIGSVVIVAATFGIFSYLTGHIKFSQYLLLPFIKESGEITVYLSALIGAGLSFLWFNAYPAQILMGDTGALALGGALGLVAILIRKEILLLIVGGIFVVETLSVILQVASYKLRKIRIFKMTPIHHHFEMKGWSEPKIVVRFWIINIILALITFSTLKLR